MAGMDVEHDFGSSLLAVVDDYNLKRNTVIQLKPRQIEVFEILFDHQKDIIVCLPTGYGKSLVFHLSSPLLKVKYDLDFGTTLVISPLNAIQHDQINQLQRCGIAVCKLDVKGRGKTYDSDGFEKVNIQFISL